MDWFGSNRIRETSRTRTWPISLADINLTWPPSPVCSLSSGTPTGPNRHLGSCGNASSHKNWAHRSEPITFVVITKRDVLNFTESGQVLCSLSTLKCLCLSVFLSLCLSLCFFVSLCLFVSLFCSCYCSCSCSCFCSFSCSCSFSPFVCSSTLHFYVYCPF